MISYLLYRLDPTLATGRASKPSRTSAQRSSEFFGRP
jgi:hypothetical protein